MVRRPPRSTLSLHDALPICAPAGCGTTATRCSRGASATWWGRRTGAATSSPPRCARTGSTRSEEHTSELQSRQYLVCRLLLEKKRTRLTYILAYLSYDVFSF